MTDPTTLAAGALSQLAADARNGTGPDARLYGYLRGLGISQADAEAAVRRIVRAVDSEAVRLVGQGEQSELWERAA